MLTLVRGCWLVVLVTLSGCASDTAVKITQRSSQADAPFTFNGRVAVKHDGERSTAGLRWAHRADEDEMLLLAPLGQTVARIHRDAQGVTLDESGRHHAAQDVESLTRKVLGWELPLSGLSYWATALPVRGAPAAIQRNRNGQIASLHQEGWEIEYSRYASEAADSLPLRFVLRRERLEIMVLIDEWEKQ
jgi:outer membrane lipoprotein LolB